MSWRKSPWIFAAVLLVGVVAIGGASFLLKGLTSTKDAKAAKRLAPEKLMELRHAPTKLLSLKWGSGKGSTVNETIQYVFTSHDKIFVVDTNPSTLLPRVRWFSRSNQLLGSFQCPVGSTDFAPYRDGFSFVIAPGAKKGAEKAALYSVARAKLITYMIPSQTGSAGLLERGDTLYAQADDSVFDVNAMTVSIEGRLLPVAVRGRQLDIKTATEGILKARYLGADGHLYGRRIHAISGNESSQEQFITDVDASSTIQIPPAGEFLGTDASGLIYVLTDYKLAATSFAVAGVTRDSDATTLILTSDRSGNAQSVLPIAEPHRFPYMPHPFSVCPQGLVALRVTQSSVDVLLYQKKVDD